MTRIQEVSCPETQQETESVSNTNVYCFLFQRVSGYTKTAAKI